MCLTYARSIGMWSYNHMKHLKRCMTGICERDLFDRFFKIEFSSHSIATRIALSGDLIRAYHTVQLSRIGMDPGVGNTGHIPPPPPSPAVTFLH